MSKRDTKTEKFHVAVKVYKVTAVNGAEITIEAMNQVDLMTQILEFLESQQLSFPLGLRPGGIVEVNE